MVTMVEKPDRLYGIPGAEQLHLDIAAAYESQVEPRLEYHGALVEHEAHAVIEEWTVQPARNLLPDANAVLEHVVETAGEEGDEWWYEHCESAAGDSEVVEAFEKALDLLGSKIHYWMADKCVATHRVTWDESGPLVDGEALYREQGVVVDWCRTHEENVVALLSTHVITDDCDVVPVRVVAGGET